MVLALTQIYMKRHALIEDTTAADPPPAAEAT
jgi:hypothetical protein